MRFWAYENGESVAVFYQPNCIFNDSGNNITIYGTIYHYAAPHMCANFIFDLNGKKGPNTAGKDIGFMTVFYPSDSQVVMPIPLHKDSATYTTYENALAVCRNVSPDVRLPNKEELAALAINENLIDISSSHNLRAATLNWKMVSQYLVWSTASYGSGLCVRCIKR